LNNYSIFGTGPGAKKIFLSRFIQCCKEQLDISCFFINILKDEMICASNPKIPGYYDLSCQLKKILSGEKPLIPFF